MPRRLWVDNLNIVIVVIIIINIQSHYILLLSMPSFSSPFSCAIACAHYHYFRGRGWIVYICKINNFSSSSCHFGCRHFSIILIIIIHYQCIVVVIIVAIESRRPPLSSLILLISTWRWGWSTHQINHIVCMYWGWHIIYYLDYLQWIPACTTKKSCAMWLRYIIMIEIEKIMILVPVACRVLHHYLCKRKNVM